MRRARRVRGKKRSGGLFLGLFFLLILAGAAVFIYTAPQFEQIPPKVEIAPKIVLGKSGELQFSVSDNYALKSVTLILKNGAKEYTVVSEKLPKGVKSKKYTIKLPKEVLAGATEWDFELKVTDSSLWNFLTGNSTRVLGKIYIDNKAPFINIIAKSQAILHGGSGAVVYSVDEDNLKESYVDLGNGIHFKATPYKKKGVFATLIAWPFNMERFSANIVAIDKAGNVAKIPLEIREHKKSYRVSYIEAKDRFIDGKIAQLAASDREYAKITDRVQKLKAINELMRQKNEALIHKYSKKVTPLKGDWNVTEFYPLHGAKKVSDFGVKRYYYYKKRSNIVSTSYHLGYDFASIKNDKIYSSSAGRVVFASYNGIYGNMPLIDHGFGLYTLYGHCSKILVKVGQKVKAGEVIALTGKSGLALGDHLHFGMLVQGVEVYPLEWMNKKWIKDFIMAVFQKADKKIGYN